MNLRWLSRQSLDPLTTETQFAVRYGDGEIDGPLRDRATAQNRIKDARWHIANDPDWDGEDYEPMTLVTRIHVVQVTPWIEVPA